MRIEPVLRKEHTNEYRDDVPIEITVEVNYTEPAPMPDNIFGIIWYYVLFGWVMDEFFGNWNADLAMYW
ncbi:MAG: hypothetical protein LBR73_09980 [Oscillospiraceae bacterium]|nr:hypothetical protein [Oscillospiraceae bacterium]